MVQVDIKRKQHTIHEITIRHHAVYANKGKDLVCAGVSCISIGTLNALDRLCNGKCILDMKDAYIHIVVKQPDHQKTQIILETMHMQLMTVQEKYQQYITITDQEV